MKYGNKKVRYDGIIFDSRKEARRYYELKLLQRAGQIKNLELQKSFELIPAQYETFKRIGKTGKELKDGRRLLEKSCNYIADFVYTDAKTGKQIVEDTKGMRTKDYIIKRKLMLYRYGIKIIEI